MTILVVPSVVDPHVSVELFIQRSEEFWANYLKLYLKKRTSKPCLCLFTYIYVKAPFWFIQASHPGRELFCCINFYAVESLDKEHSVLIIKYLLPSVQPQNCLLRPGSADQDVSRLFLPKSTVFSSRLRNREREDLTQKLFSILQWICDTKKSSLFDLPYWGLLGVK